MWKERKGWLDRAGSGNIEAEARINKAKKEVSEREGDGGSSSRPRGGQGRAQSLCFSGRSRAWGKSGQEAGGGEGSTESSWDAREARLTL